MRPGRMPRKYVAVTSTKLGKLTPSFNEAGADAPEIQCFHAIPLESANSFNEAGADAPEIQRVINHLKE